METEETGRDVCGDEGVNKIKYLNGATGHSFEERLKEDKSPPFESD